ncbi:5'-methylthioadenosine/adenosylhomocysteine nucleosidase [Fundicoccus culcitae]|uniref:adenosylhomocysteine nucleosidase n=1 Tax=Fundicoccus culcitae TaxID=2969821 RepID=A0ABY5P639_9LACT|nr:5'-methylthioadenosine/adenosylhomocysteine nucleosidase [Fundicoccus culcitae]UUX34019.1 5'-methylthioadenosine/adenosylhomocysteine nucleosidase [Fundicoccus culcitae]
MKIGIIGAMEEEILMLKETIINPVIETYSGFEVVSGQLGDHQVALVLSGIGKVNATLSVMILKEKYQIDLIINTGSAGAVDPAIKVGDVVIAHSLSHHDVDVTGFGYAYGQMAGMPERYLPDSELLRIAQMVCRTFEIEPIIGLVVSGDQFINSKEQINKIRTNFPTARAVDMESAAIAQASYVLDIPYVIIRSISDNANDEASVDFDTFIELASRVSASMVIEFVKQVPFDPYAK